jgi:DNA-binding GntR family transcriptional regulator
VARSSAGRAYDVLKRQLLRGTIKPGQRIVVEEVCSRLGVSRTPVREALVALDREGLVQTVPRRGYFAREISFREALDAYQLRMILEPIATALAARRIGQKELDVLRRLIDSSAGGTSDIGTLLEMNRSFHVLIAKSAGNERLARVMADLMDDMERLVYVEFDAQHTPSDRRNEHLNIVDSLEQGSRSCSQRCPGDLYKRFGTPGGQGKGRIRDPRAAHRDRRNDAGDRRVGREPVRFTRKRTSQREEATLRDAMKPIRTEGKSRLALCMEALARKL